MKNAALLRSEIETSLAKRIPVALSPRDKVDPPRTPSGLVEVDRLLQGGLPAGSITEFVGPECSGRTSLALSYMASITRSGNVCAWIDVADALDPETVAANGVDLQRLLWIRCGRRDCPAAEAASTNHSALTLTSTTKLSGSGCGGAHPRSEGRDMPQAIGAMLQAHGGIYDSQVRREKRMIGTPGAPNRPLSQHTWQREEQVNSDRMPARRGDNLALAPRCAEPQPRRIPRQPSDEGIFAKPSAGKSISGNPWQALDQALRAADLLLQSSGFSLIVLDMGNTAPEMAWRIPSATWFRFRAACDRTRTSLVLITQHSCARSSAELVVRLQTGSIEAHNKVMTGIRYCAEPERNRSRHSETRVVSIRKPPQPERPGQWKSEAAWA